MPLRLAPGKPPVMLIAQTIDRAHPERSLPLVARGPATPKGAISVWLSEPASWLYARAPGDVLKLPIDGAVAGTRARTFFVAGVWRDYARQQGAIAMDDADYTRLTGDTLRSEASVTLAPGATAQAVIARLRASLPPGLAARAVFAEPAGLRALSLRIFDRSFAVTYLLEAIAILVGLTGVAASFSAQILARTKEFGMLRHIGVTRRQIVVMLVAEGAALGTIGIVAGLALGLAIGEVLIHVVNPQSFHWTMETRLPLTLFAFVTVALVLSAAGTALFAGRRALSGDAVRAVREDW
jgi:putative ABC transport system permease protein